MKRRTLILGTAAVSVVGATASGAWLAIAPNQEPLTIDIALKKLDQLIAEGAVANGEWNLYQVLNHCAQSVEYSMHGFPEHKSDLFKNTAGALAFSAFAAKGKMTHALNEAIPGAPELSPEGDITGAYLRFRQSLLDFQAYEGELAPHFAFGALSKAEYEAAHVMHFNNHLLEIV